MKLLPYLLQARMSEHPQQVIFRMRQRQRKEKLFYNIEGIVCLLDLDCVRSFLPVRDQRIMIFVTRLVFTSCLENLDVLDWAELGMGEHSRSVGQHVDVVLDSLEKLHDELTMLRWCL